MKIGTKVLIRRDESKYGTSRVWREYKGKTCVVHGFSLGEIGVTFDDGVTDPAWFQRYEIKERKDR